jgi:aminocarboxymuconate-semialdehyde decarboxylase
MSNSPILKVDAHAHVLTPPMFGAAGAYGPEMISHGNNLRTFRAGRYQTEPFVAKDDTVAAAANPSLRRAKMDTLGIDVMGVTISPLYYCYGADKMDGIHYAKVCNDEMEKYCDGEPGRFFFFPTLPMQDVGASVRELERMQTFKWARGVNLSTDNIAGHEFSDEYLFPVLEACEANDIVLFLHPAAIGTDEPDWDPAKNKKDVFNLGWIAGYVYRESLAHAQLILGGALDRYPNLKVCLTHGGGFVPFQLGRIGEAATRMPASRAKKPVEAYNRNFYFENSVHDPRARRYLVEIWGVDNIYAGSNFDGWDQNDAFGFAETMVDTPEDKFKIMAGNAIKLFHLDDKFGRTV